MHLQGQQLLPQEQEKQSRFVICIAVYSGGRGLLRCVVPKCTTKGSLFPAELRACSMGNSALRCRLLCISLCICFQQGCAYAGVLLVCVMFHWNPSLLCSLPVSPPGIPALPGCHSPGSQCTEPFEGAWLDLQEQFAESNRESVPAVTFTSNGACPQSGLSATQCRSLLAHLFQNSPNLSPEAPVF